MHEKIKTFVKAVDDMHELCRRRKLNMKGKFFSEHPLLENSNELAKLTNESERLFITPKGNPNYCAIVFIEDTFNKRIKIYAGEQDSFGWLTGVIETEMGKVLI